MKDGKALAAVAVIGLGLWAWKKGKLPAIPPAPREMPVWELIEPPPPVIKPPVTETPSIPLDVWQALTQQQLQALPVTHQVDIVGVEPYNKTAQPIAIGDTGFYIWGQTEFGSTVVSKKPPETYAAWEWM